MRLQICTYVCLVFLILYTLSFGSSQNPKRTVLNINQFSLLIFTFSVNLYIVNRILTFEM
jgi:hypothetical protein